MTDVVSASLEAKKVESDALARFSGFLGKRSIVNSEDLIDSVIRQLKDVSRIAEAFGNNSPDEFSKHYTDSVKIAAQKCENALLPSHVKGLKL